MARRATSTPHVFTTRNGGFKVPARDVVGEVCFEPWRGGFFILHVAAAHTHSVLTCTQESRV